MFLGLDLGTGSLKALLLGADGSVLNETSVGYPVHAPHRGWAESDPEDWWRAALHATRAVTAHHTDPIRAIGLSAQMHSLVLSDAHAQPLRRAVLWADTRSAAQLELYRRLEPDLQRRLGNPVVTGMTGPSLLWLHQFEPDLYEVSRWCLQPKDWLRFRLTREVCTEPSDASATLLYDIENDDWAWEVVTRLGLRPELLPPIHPSSHIGGTLTREAANALGLQAGIPVALGAGDTAAAMLGSGLLGVNAVQLSVGSGAQIVAPRQALQTDPLLRTHRFRTCTEAPWYAMAAMQNAGLALEAVRRMLGLSWSEAYEAAFSLPDSDGVRFLPYLSGERTPHNNPEARGAWVGLGIGHERAHLMRAAFEGVAFSIADGLEALGDVGIRPTQLRLAGGGTLDARWRQLLADTLQCDLLAVDTNSASARGAALLGMVALGATTLADIASATPAPRLVASPRPSDALVEAREAFKALYRKLET
jgi:xylulokinase